MKEGLDLIIALIYTFVLVSCMLLLIIAKTDWLDKDLARLVFGSASFMVFVGVPKEYLWSAGVSFLGLLIMIFYDQICLIPTTTEDTKTEIQKKDS